MIMSFESMPSSLLFFGSDVIAKMTVLILVVIFVDRVTRSRSAAFRHRLWAFTFVAIACLPVASYFMPGLPIAIVPANWVEPSAPSLAVSSIASDQRSAPPPETGSVLESAPWGSQASVERRGSTSFLRPEAGALARCLKRTTKSFSSLLH